MKNQNFLSFIGGLAIGAIAALLLAPDSGANTRNKISGKIKHGKKRCKNCRRWSRRRFGRSNYRPIQNHTIKRNLVVYGQ